MQLCPTAPDLCHPRSVRVVAAFLLVGFFVARFNLKLIASLVVYPL
jgi:hypothetical protein